MRVPRISSWQTRCLDFGVSLLDLQCFLEMERSVVHVELALQADVDRTYVSQLERGVANPSILILHRISTVLGMDLSISLQRASDA